MRWPRLLAAALAAPLLAACAASPPLQWSQPAQQPPAADIHRCLVRSRNVESGSLAHGRVIVSRYNDCMQRLGWRDDTRAVSTGPRG
jgi:hypothetical protein